MEKEEEKIVCTFWLIKVFFKTLKISFFFFNLDNQKGGKDLYLYITVKPALPFYIPFALSGTLCIGVVTLSLPLPIHLCAV